jgi:hypothetical protein
MNLKFDLFSNKSENLSGKRKNSQQIENIPHSWMQSSLSHNNEKSSFPYLFSTAKVERIFTSIKYYNNEYKKLVEYWNGESWWSENERLDKEKKKDCDIENDLESSNTNTPVSNSLSTLSWNSPVNNSCSFPSNDQKPPIFTPPLPNSFNSFPNDIPIFIPPSLSDQSQQPTLNLTPSNINTSSSNFSSHYNDLNSSPSPLNFVPPSFLFNGLQSSSPPVFKIPPKISENNFTSQPSSSFFLHYFFFVPFFIIPLLVFLHPLSSSFSN